MTGLFTATRITGRAAAAMISAPVRKGMAPLVPVSANTPGPRAKPVESTVP